MLNSFCEWAQATIPSLVGLGAKSELTVGPASLNPGARLDIETSHRIFARITFWSTGEYDAEALDFSGKDIYWHHGQIGAESSMEEEFREFFAVIDLPIPE